MKQQFHDCTEQLKLIRITTVPISLKILLKGQLRYMNQFFNVVGVSSSGKEMFEVSCDEGVRIVTLEMKRQISLLSDFISLYRIIRLIKKEKPYILHTHTPKAGTLGMVAGWLSRVPVRLHTVAGLPLMEEVGMKRVILNWVEKLTYFCATKIYPNSYGLRDFIVQQRFCSSSKLKVIANGSTNGIDTNFYSPHQVSEDTKMELMSKFQISTTDFVFVFIGRLVKDKGVNELVSAFVMLNLTYPNSKLILVGEKESELDPLNDITEEHISNHHAIIFTGFQKDVRPYLAIAHALVFPSYREGFPNVPMQAGAMGVPSIVTDINGCNEIIQPGKNGEIILPRDEVSLLMKMTEWIASPGKVKRMAANSRNLIVTRFEQQVVWEALLKEYREQIETVKI